MKISFNFETEQEQLPLDYRVLLMSYFKHCLSLYEDGTYLDTYYGKGCRKKAFSFSVNLGKCHFSKKNIIVPGKKFVLSMNYADDATAIIFYNALMQQKKNLYPMAYGNMMKLKSAYMHREVPIDKGQLVFRTTMPIVVRDHNRETNKDWYYSFQNENFNTMLRRNTGCDFVFVPLSMKKTVVKFHGTFIECSVGTFVLQGDVETLTALYRTGIGSRTACGFGTFDIIG